MDSSPWGGKESDTAERLTLFTFTLGQPELCTKHNSSAIRLFLQLPHHKQLSHLTPTQIKPFFSATQNYFRSKQLPPSLKQSSTSLLPSPAQLPTPTTSWPSYHSTKKKTKQNKITQAFSQEKLLNPVLCNFTAHLL